MGPNEQLTELLQRTFEDLKIDNQEKVSLYNSFADLSAEQRAFVRNRAFEMVRQFSREAPDEKPPYKWLEKVIKSLDGVVPVAAVTEVAFSPGEECRDLLLGLIAGATNQLQICVFTISDNRLRDAIFAAWRRGIDVQIITDNDKANDKGSDIDWLDAQGVPVRVDRTRHHMHHKFVIADGKQVATGSFNWTLSATVNNHENILLTNNALVVRQFTAEFDQLWHEFA